jgi:hypothetical protein
MTDTVAHLVSFTVSVTALVILILAGHDTANILTSIAAGLIGSTGYASVTSLAKQQNSSFPSKDNSP